MARAHLLACPRLLVQQLNSILEANVAEIKGGRGSERTVRPIRGMREHTCDGESGRRLHILPYIMDAPAVACFNSPLVVTLRVESRAWPFLLMSHVGTSFRGGRKLFSRALRASKGSSFEPRALARCCAACPGRRRPSCCAAAGVP